MKFQKEKKIENGFENAPSKRQNILVLFCFKLLLKFFFVFNFSGSSENGVGKESPWSGPETNGGLIIICCATASLSYKVLYKSGLKKSNKTLLTH